MTTIGIVGNKGKGVKSDCFITFEITEKGGIEIILESKVKVMYGDSIIKLANEILKFFNIESF